MNVLVVAHAHPARGQVRGGEKSVRIICEYLVNKQGLDVTVVCPGYGRRSSFDKNGVRYVDDLVINEHVKRSDVVLTWGVPADRVSAVCRKYQVPYILMVRWWRNVCPLPPGDLLKREIDQAFVKSKMPLFTGAASIITNNVYATRVIKRWYGVNSKVSYVPLEDESRVDKHNEGKYVTLVTDAKDLGEPDVIRAIARLSPQREFLVVNASQKYGEKNIHTAPYVHDMHPVYMDTSVLIYPVYFNDVCGTSRVAAEAMRYGIPTIANNRSGICECGNFALDYEAPAEDWVDAIEAIHHFYEWYKAAVLMKLEEYNSEAQLEVFAKEIDRAVFNGCSSCYN